MVNDYILGAAMIFGAAAILEFTMINHDNVIKGVLRAMHSALIASLLYAGAFLIVSGIVAVFKSIF